MKIVKYVIIAFVIAIGFSGCASSMVSNVNKDLSKITENKDKSYITFSRPAFVGAALTNTIIEFDPQTKDTKFVGVLGAKNKLIYTTEPGTHYFFMDGGENDDMIKVNTEANKMYYIQTKVGFGLIVGRFYFEPYRYEVEKIIETMENSKCDKKFISDNKFEKQSKEENSISSLSDKYQSDYLGITIECASGKVNNINRLSGYSLDELNNATLIEPNEKAYTHYKEKLNSYILEISEDFQDWEKEDMKNTQLNTNDGFKL